MLLRKQDVAQTAFEDKNNFRNETLFFLHDPNFYYTRLPNFRKVFQTLVLKLNILIIWEQRLLIYSLIVKSLLMLQ